MSCSKVSLISLSESVRRGLILIGRDIHRGFVWEAHVDHMQIHMQMQIKTN